MNPGLTSIRPMAKANLFSRQLGMQQNPILYHALPGNGSAEMDWHLHWPKDFEQEQHIAEVPSSTLGATGWIIPWVPERIVHGAHGDQAAAPGLSPESLRCILHPTAPLSGGLGWLQVLHRYRLGIWGKMGFTTSNGDPTWLNHQIIYIG